MMGEAICEHQLLPSVESERAADLLADSLRKTRVTVLYAASDFLTFRFLSFSLVPRLGRRPRDRCLMRDDTDAGLASPGRDRRRSEQQDGLSTAEIVVRVQDWSGPGLACLQASVRRSFVRAGAWVSVVSLPGAARFASWSALLQARFLVICEHFETFLDAAESRGDDQEFAAEWLRILRQPDLPVNVLFCVSGDARPRMEAFLQGIRAEPGSGVYLSADAANTLTA